MRAFERDVVASGIRRILKLELSVYPQNWTVSLRGSAMLVVNPPFGLEAEARPMLEWLWGVLSTRREGGWTVRWLVPE